MLRWDQRLRPNLHVVSRPGDEREELLDDERLVRITLVDLPFPLLGRPIKESDIYAVPKEKVS